MANRMKDIVQGRITNGTLFPNISVSISSAMTSLVDQTAGQLRSDVTVVLSRVESDFHVALKGQRGRLRRNIKHGGAVQEVDDKVLVARFFFERVEELQRAHARSLETIITT